MTAIINYQIQDSEALLIAVDTNKAAMTAKGFTEESYNDFINSKENLRLKELAQQNAVKQLEEMTVKQNAEVDIVIGLIKKVKNSARSAYGNDENNLKLFRIGEAVTKSVKKLRPLCEYLISLINEKSGLLLKNGLAQEDIDELNAAYGRLIAADANQENAKKLKSGATKIRDDASKDLKDKMFRVRSFAKACFAGNKEILPQFEPIAKGASAKSKISEEIPAEQAAEV